MPPNPVTAIDAYEALLNAGRALATAVEERLNTCPSRPSKFSPCSADCADCGPEQAAILQWARAVVVSRRELAPLLVEVAANLAADEAAADELDAELAEALFDELLDACDAEPEASLRRV